MTKTQYGSFEIQSVIMKHILSQLDANKHKKFFLVIGEAGSGRTLTMNYIHQTIFHNQSTCLIDNEGALPFECESAIIACTAEKSFEYLKQIDLSTAHLIELPRLADRRADILPFAQFFLQVLSLMTSKRPLKLTEKSAEKLLQYSWPGHFSELESVLEEAYQAACQDDAKANIEPEHIQLNIPVKEAEFTIGQKLDEVERKYILQTLYFVHQNRTKAAEILGISIRTLRNKINQYREEGYL